MREVGRATLPEDRRELLAVYGRFLRSMTDLIAPAGGRVKQGPAALLLYAMWLRLVQLGRAVQEVCIDGFGARSPDAGPSHDRLRPGHDAVGFEGRNRR